MALLDLDIKTLKTEIIAGLIVAIILWSFHFILNFVIKTLEVATIINESTIITTISDILYFIIPLIFIIIFYLLYRSIKKIENINNELNKEGKRFEKTKLNDFKHIVETFHSLIERYNTEGFSRIVNKVINSTSKTSIKEELRLLNEEFFNNVENKLSTYLLELSELNNKKIDEFVLIMKNYITYVNRLELLIRENNILDKKERETLIKDLKNPKGVAHRRINYFKESDNTN